MLAGRHRSALAAAATLLMLTGCAATAGAAPNEASPTTMPAMSMSPGTRTSPGMTRSPGMKMSPKAAGAAAGAAGASVPAPSESARMICSRDVQRSIQRILGLRARPSPVSTWEDRVFTCTYRLPTGTLVLSVRDSTDIGAGARYFTASKQRLGHARPLRGLAGFGLPSYETNAGLVGFLKDGKTLQVDATAQARAAGPDHQSRADVAYAVAADVVACWSE
jgi:hypothetical protein